MSTISIPLPADLEKSLGQYVKKNNIDSKASVVRQALYEFLENEAVMTVLRSEQEAKEGKIIKGNLKDILK
jgi:Arc/MetJ-type ribon-helix-helix transcriptional regulator